MRKLRKFLWKVIHHNTRYDREVDHALLSMTPEDQGSAFVNVTAYGIIYNKFMNKCVQVKQISGTFDKVIVSGVKVEGDVFYIKGQYVNYDVKPDDPFEWVRTDWIHESKVYMYVGP